MRSRKPRWYIVKNEDKVKRMASAGFATKFERGKWWVLAEMRSLLAFN